jgi:hypothetical protein
MSLNSKKIKVCGSVLVTQSKSLYHLSQDIWTMYRDWKSKHSYKFLGVWVQKDLTGTLTSGGRDYEKSN